MVMAPATPKTAASNGEGARSGIVDKSSDTTPAVVSQVASQADDDTNEDSEPQQEQQEPLLKYERVGGHFHAIFKDDSLSCIALHVNFLCVGTYNGNVLLLELDGRFIRRLHQHYKKVNHVCIDETGQYIASCSDDGTVAVYTLFPPSSASSSANARGSTASTTSTTSTAASVASSAGNAHISVASTGGEVNIYNYFSAIYTVQLEDRYALKRERSFACGGISGQLIINKKGWIIDKESTVHEGEGPVHAIKWKDGLVAWANDWGVKVYDAEKDQRITYLERPPQCPPMELCRCHLEWQSSSMLLVGWANTLRVVAFKKVNPLTPTAAGTSTGDQGAAGAMLTLTAEVVSLITFDFFVAGISVWNTTGVCVLAYRPPGSAPATSSQTTETPAKTENRLVEGEGDAIEIPFPEVHVVSLDGKQVSADILNLRGYHKLRAADYKMPSLQYAHSTPSTAFASNSSVSPSLSSIYDAGYGKLQYICTPKDVVICRLRDVDDRVGWALSRKKYQKALEVALHDPKSLRRHSMEELIEYYLGELLKKKQFKQAAEEIKRLFVSVGGTTGPQDDYAKLWEKYVYVFAQRGQLSAIAKFIPTANPRLPTVQYEMVLKHFLDSDPGQLLEIIRKWPKPRQHAVVRSKNATVSAAMVATTAAAPEYTETAFVFEPLYDAQAWINQLEAVVRRRRIAESGPDSSSSSSSSSQLSGGGEKISVETSYILEALAELYSATEQYDHALRIYLSQGAFCTNKDHAFKLISEHQLWPLVQNKIVNLMQIDRPSAVRMLVNQTEQLKIVDVVKQLEHDRELLHEYLHELFVHRFTEYNTEIYSSLHDAQVALYTEFAPSSLLKFLQTSNFVPLEKAFKYCSDRNPPLWDAMIYILGRMGQHKRALDLILTQMRDINQAIQFVQDNDESLWEYLIDLSLTSKENIEELLHFAAQHKIDPIKLIRKIPEDVHIDDLKHKLLEIVSNYRIQQNLCEGCNKVFESDRMQLLQRQVAARKRGRRVAPKKACSICNEVLRPPTVSAVGRARDGGSNASHATHVCVFECGHSYHLPCLEEKMRMWKRSAAAFDRSTSGDGTLDLVALRDSLGCFVCDHSTRAYASRTAQLDFMVKDQPPPRGITEDQLQRAKDVLTLKMAA